MIQHFLDIARVGVIICSQSGELSFHGCLELCLVVEQVLQALKLCFVSKGPGPALVGYLCFRAGDGVGGRVGNCVGPMVVIERAK